MEAARYFALLNETQIIPSSFFFLRKYLDTAAFPKIRRQATDGFQQMRKLRNGQCQHSIRTERISLTFCPQNQNPTGQSLTWSSWPWSTANYNNLYRVLNRTFIWEKVNISMVFGTTIFEFSQYCQMSISCNWDLVLADQPSQTLILI